MEDLRAYLSLLEEAGGRGFKKSTRGYSGHAAHRVDRTPSLGVFIGSEGGIVVHDFSWKKSWSAYNYLKEALGREDLARRWLEMTGGWDPTKDATPKRWNPTGRRNVALPKETTYTEITPSTDEWEATARAKMAEAREAIENGEHPDTLRYMEERGLKPEYAYAAGLGAVEMGIAIPVYDDNARLKGIKVRKWDESEGRFVSVFPGRGNGYYFSPDFTWKPMQRVIIVEGELNAAAVYLALDIPTIGLPGASTGLSRNLAKRLKEYAGEVVVITDQDDPGRELRERIVGQLYDAGYDRARIRIPMEDRYHRDAMDILKDRGLEYLTEYLKAYVYEHGTHVKMGRGASTAVAKAAARRYKGLNTKRALANATGEVIVRRHAKFIPENELEAVSVIEDYLTEKVMAKSRGKAVKAALIRKAVRRWMVMNSITARTALFLVYELKGVKTGSREFKGGFSYQRQHHPLIQKYRIYDEKMNLVGFDVAKLLEDAATTILAMLEEVASFFRKVAERIKEERDAFAAWIKDAPRLLAHIVRKKVSAVAASPPATLAA
jgi:5S rRNA maturation endonuclease (ribonuclease M5)